MSFFKGWEDFRLHALSEVIGLVLSISRRLRPAHLGVDGAAALCRIDNRHDTVLPWDAARSERGMERVAVGEEDQEKGRKKKRSNPPLSVHLATLHPAFVFFRSGMMEFREGSAGVSLSRAHSQDVCMHAGSRRSASLIVTHEELSQLLLMGRRRRERKTRVLGYEKQGNRQGARVLLFAALLSHTNQIRASTWKEKCLFFQTHSTNVDGLTWENEPLKINNNNKSESGGLPSQMNSHSMTTVFLCVSRQIFTLLSSLPAASLFFPATWE